MARFVDKFSDISINGGPHFGQQFLLYYMDPFLCVGMCVCMLLCVFTSILH